MTHRDKAPAFGAQWAASGLCSRAMWDSEDSACCPPSSTRSPARRGLWAASARKRPPEPLLVPVLWVCSSPPATEVLRQASR